MSMDVDSVVDFLGQDEATLAQFIEKFIPNVEAQLAQDYRPGQLSSAELSRFKMLSLGQQNAIIERIKKIRTYQEQGNSVKVKELEAELDRMSGDAEPEVKSRAAGVLVLTNTDDKMNNHGLFLERSPKGDHSGEWCLPGGMLEEGEEPQDAALRELEEETGYRHDGDLEEYHRSVSPEGLEYTTYIARVPEIFKPEPNNESTQAIWRGLDNLPQPLHPGVADMFGQDDAEAEERRLARLKDELNKGPFDLDLIKRIIDLQVHLGHDAQVSPLGMPYQPWNNNYDKDEQPLGFAYTNGRNAYMAGELESANPHQDKMGAEWTRGYRVARGDDRFKATIRKRNAAKTGAKDEAFNVKVYGPNDILIREIKINAKSENEALHKVVIQKINKANTYYVEQAHDAKLSHEAVDYGEGKPEEQCSLCEYFDGGSCKLVEGPIDPKGWCKLFTNEDEQFAHVDIDFDHDGPWMSCMSKDRTTMYVNSHLPRKADVDESGEKREIAPILLHHEVPEVDELEELIEEFKAEHGREPNKKERIQLYLKAHHSAGTPSERDYCKRHDINWMKYSAWCRGQEERIEKLPVKNPPKDADVRLVKHHHGDLEVTMDEANFKEEDHPRASNGQFGSGGGGAAVSKESGGSEKAASKSQKALRSTLEAAGVSAEIIEKALASVEEPKEEGENKSEHGEHGEHKSPKEHVKAAKEFFNQPNVTKRLGVVAKDFFKKHAKGASHYHFNHNIVVPLIHGVMAETIGHLGGSIPEMAAASVVGYALHNVAHHLGFTPQVAQSLLISLGKGLLEAYKTGELRESVASGQLEHGRDAAPKKDQDKDPTIESISRMVRILEKTPLKDLLKAGESQKKKVPVKARDEALAFDGQIVFDVE